MRSVILISILFFHHPFSAFAIPLQRRGAQFPDAVAGSSEAHANTAEIIAASPAAISEAVGTEHGPPPARVDIEGTLPEEVVKSPPEVKPSFFQRITNAMKPEKIQDTLRAAAEKVDEEWQKEKDVVRDNMREFTDRQQAQLQEARLELLAQAINFREKQRGLLTASDVKWQRFLGAQDSKERQFRALQDAKRWDLLAARESKRQKFLDAQDAKITAFLEKYTLGPGNADNNRKWRRFQAKRTAEWRLFVTSQENKLESFHNRMAFEAEKFKAKQQSARTKYKAKRRKLMATQESKEMHFIPRQEAKLVAVRAKIRDDMLKKLEELHTVLVKGSDKRERKLKYINALARKFGTGPILEPRPTEEASSPLHADAAELLK